MTLSQNPQAEYLYRKGAFSQEEKYTLYNRELHHNGKPIPLTDIQQVRLSFEPTRLAPFQHVCRLELKNGQTLFFTNYRYKGIADFQMQHEAYVKFIRKLHEALQKSGHKVIFSAGASRTKYNFMIVLFGISLLFSLIILLFHVIVGLLYLGVLLWFFLRWLGKNKPRTYTPEAIPPQVLPNVVSKPAGSSRSYTSDD